MEKLMQERWQLSSSATVFMYKFTSFLAIVGFLVMSQVWRGYNRGMFPMYCASAACAWALFRHQGLRNVAIDGGFVMVKHAGHEERLALRDLISVRQVSLIFREAISMRFRDGRKVRFAGPMQISLSSANPLLKELRRVLDIKNG